MESERAEMGSEAGPRRGHYWQTRFGVQAGMGWGVLRRRLLPLRARASWEAPGWGPSLLVAGLAGARWTWVGAVEWGCGGRRGCELEMVSRSTSHASMAASVTGGHQLPPGEMRVSAWSWAWGSADGLRSSAHPRPVLPPKTPGHQGLLLPSDLTPTDISLSLAWLGPPYLHDSSNPPSIVKDPTTAQPCPANPVQMLPEAASPCPTSPTGSPWA